MPGLEGCSLAAGRHEPAGPTAAEFDATVQDAAADLNANPVNTAPANVMTKA